MPVIIVHVLVICYNLMKIIANVIKKNIYMSNLYYAVTLWEWLTDRLIQVDGLIQL